MDINGLIKERELEKQNILSGKTKIKVYHYDGEYLTGYQADGGAAKVLEELKLAHYVDGLGYLVNDDLVKALGTEFSYQQAKEFAQPMLDKIAEDENRRKQALDEIFAEAKATGKRVLIESYTDDCDCPFFNCCIDIDNVDVYAMPNGTIKEFRTHCY